MRIRSPRSNKEKPRPEIFAILRNGHEVIRGATPEVNNAIGEADFEGALELWKALSAWEKMHMSMEEGNDNCKGFFRVLDEKRNNIAATSNLSANHKKLESLENALEKALEEEDQEEISEVFEAFQKENEAHLTFEETIMMPEVMGLVNDGESLKKIMMEDVLPAVDDMEFFLKYAMKILETHHENKPRARVFAHAMWAASTDDEWIDRKKWIQETVETKLYKEIDGLCQRETEEEELAPSIETAPIAAPVLEDKSIEPKRTGDEKVQVFAIMRNSHEVIRGAFRDVGDAIANADFQEADDIWKALSVWEQMHMAMEEGNSIYKGFFRVLDEQRNNLATEKGLRNNHKKLVILEKSLSELLESGEDQEAIAYALTAYELENEAHLTFEEEIMMPEVMSLVNEGVLLKKIMMEDLLPLIDDMEFFLKFAMKILQKHHGDKDRARVFAQAMWAASTDEEWADRKIWIKESVAPELYKEIDTLCQWVYPKPTQQERKKSSHGKKGRKFPSFYKRKVQAPEI
eukprot:CAMPEP_0198281664 /NCGR_PEP_ID=MMETSP1449-20131203/1584_1 /TAXON_ID=420275 /ORGANISM="Attheya septentrionalis, Strain CCMP2084" /LENGTH=517 /DNA_ID=CAMNT_0043977561 /DNA_START=168 /DNA_END=1721 /DNA_ORIENTATION=+